MAMAVVDPGLSPRPLTREQFEILVAAGVYEDARVELIEGVVVDMAPQGPGHGDMIGRINTTLAVRFAAEFGTRYMMRPQVPLAATDLSAPSPMCTSSTGPTVARRLTFARPTWSSKWPRPASSETSASSAHLCRRRCALRLGRRPRRRAGRGSDRSAARRRVGRSRHVRHGAAPAPRHRPRRIRHHVAPVRPAALTHPAPSLSARTAGSAGGITWSSTAGQRHRRDRHRRHDSPPPSRRRTRPAGAHAPPVRPARLSQSPDRPS